MSAKVLKQRVPPLLPEGVVSSVEFVKVSPKWQVEFGRFLNDLNDHGDGFNFSPHKLDEEAAQQIASNYGLDLYFLMVLNGRIIGYGLLRGWDEGYEIPSLGLAIHPSVRGTGAGKLLMDFLHFVAAQQGATKVRLRVHINNVKALRLYKYLGYVFSEGGDKDDYFVGFKTV